MAKLKFEKDGISVDVDKEELKEIFSAYFQMLSQQPSAPKPAKPEKKVVVKVIPRKKFTETNVIDYIHAHPFKTYVQVGRAFGVKREIINAIAIKHGIRKHKKWRLTKKEKATKSVEERKGWERMSDSKLKEVEGFVLAHPEVSITKVAERFGIHDSTLYYHFPDLMKKRKEMKNGLVKIKGKLPEGGEKLVYGIPPQLQKHKRHVQDYYKQSYVEIEKIILSSKVPEEFRLIDVYNAMFGKKPDWKYSETHNRFTLIRNTVKKMEDENKVKMVGEEQVSLKGDIKAFRKRYIWKKLVKSEEKIDVYNIMFGKTEENMEEKFPYTEVTRKEAIDAIKQAIFNKKLTYLKDGSFFGYDMRRTPDTNWFNLITYIAKLVKEKMWAKDVKIDFQTKGLTFY